MSDAKYPAEWKSWYELTEQQKRYAIADKEFWSKISEEQRSAFLDEADWQEIRHCQEARTRYIDAHISLEEICKTLGMTHVQVYWMMSTRKLPGALIDGVWKFNPRNIERWVEKIGGKEAALKDVEAQIAKHRAGGQHGGTKETSEGETNG